MSEEESRVMICRSVKDGLKPRARTGYECSICQEALQLTPDGFAMLQSHPASTLFCNECGFLYVTMAGDGIEHTEMSSEAKSQLAEGNRSPLAGWVRKRA